MAVAHPDRPPLYPALSGMSTTDLATKGSRLIKSRYSLHRDANHVDQPSPPGWTRHNYHGSESDRKTYLGAFRNRRYFYFHESNPGAKFWYPIETCQPSTELVNYPPAMYLLAVTERTKLFARNLSVNKSQYRISLYDGAGAWLGVLRLHNESDGLLLKSAGVCEVAAVSLGEADNSREEEPGLDEWDFEERPKSRLLYEFYNVLWIDWAGGLARRRGVGRIMKTAWERQKRELFTMILA